MNFTNEEIKNAIKDLTSLIDTNRLMYLKSLTDEDKKWSLNRIEQLESKISELEALLDESK